MGFLANLRAQRSDLLQIADAANFWKLHIKAILWKEFTGKVFAAKIYFLVVLNILDFYFRW